MANASVGTAVYSSAGINVNPTSSTLPLRIEDVDCSVVADFPSPPLDGQFVIAPGKVAFNFSYYTGDDADVINAKMQNDVMTGLEEKFGVSLAMVYLSQFKGDVLGAKCIPVVRGPLRFKTKMFLHQGDIAADLVAGTPLTVQADDDVISGSARRLLLCAATKKCAWVVGFVTRVISSLAGSEEIEVQLYDFPRQVQLNA
jgi:hypothetical protein